MRLTRPVEPEHVAGWANDFADLLGGEGIEMRSALEDEHAQEPELDALPRLVLRYDQGQAGRLRQLIDRINREG
jgi:hypothetical protein